MRPVNNLVCFFDREDENPWFSNWYPCRFFWQGIRFTTLEQYMMYRKACVFGDEDTRAAILATDDPARIKAWGRKVQNYQDDVWKGLRQVIVYEGLLAKFGQNVDLREKLLDTGDAPMAECSPFDRVWGIGIGIHDPRRLDRDQWQGENLMGYTLMLVRERLRQQ